MRCSTLVFAIRPGETTAWSVGLDDGTGIAADAIVLTCPLPQSFSLLITAGVELPPDLRLTDYDRTLALLAVLDRPAAIPAPGGVQDADETFSFIGDNEAKGVSAVPAVTFHARPDWSLERWDRPPDEVHAELIERARPWLGGAAVVESQLKRWRFATPKQVWPDPCWRAPDPPGPARSRRGRLRWSTRRGRSAVRPRRGRGDRGELERSSDRRTELADHVGHQVHVGLGRPPVGDGGPERRHRPGSGSCRT